MGKAAAFCQQTVSACGCSLSLSGQTLTACSPLLQRTWNITAGGLVPAMLKLGSAAEPWTRPEDEALAPAVQTELPCSMHLTGGEADDCGAGTPHLAAQLTLNYAHWALRYEVRLYPQLPLLRCRIWQRGGPAADCPAVTLEAVTLMEQHWEWTAADLRAVTDTHNDLVQQQSGITYPTASRRLTGQVLRLHRTLRSDGLVLIREAPGGEEQTRWPGWDFLLAGNRAAAVAAPLCAHECIAAEWVPLYGTALMGYSGGELGFRRTLMAYHEARHRPQPAFDGCVYSNTWGDDTDGKNISEAFVQRDLTAAASCGITHYQIDAGWDSRQTDSAGRQCWKIDQSRLPHGFAPFCRSAKACGVTRGLWFEPNARRDNSYPDWECDARQLLAFYREYGFTFFKLDGFYLSDYLALAHFEQMLQYVRTGSQAQVRIDIDVTNWPRTGYFGAVQYGGIFLENRYTDRGTYYPHRTLRNLWQLCSWLPLYRIEAEFLNPVRRTEQYPPNDPLSPASCGLVYALACVLFASPLAWMEPSILPAAQQKTLWKILHRTAAQRALLLHAIVLPLGGVPDGVRFTGFQAILGEGEGLLLLIREAGENPQLPLPIRDFRNCNCRSIFSSTHATLRRTAYGVLPSLEKPFSAVLYAYRPRAKYKEESL